MNPVKEYIMQAGEAARVMNRSPGVIARLGQIITPHYSAGGKGFRAGYSLQNVVEMRIVEEMIKFGVPRKRIATYLQTLRSTDASWLEKDGWIVIDGRWQWQLTNEFSAIPLGWRDGGSVSYLTIGIGKIRQELLAEYKNLMEEHI